MRAQIIEAVPEYSVPTFESGASELSDDPAIATYLLLVKGGFHQPSPYLWPASVGGRQHRGHVRM